MYSLYSRTGCFIRGHERHQGHYFYIHLTLYGVRYLLKHLYSLICHSHLGCEDVLAKPHYRMLYLITLFCPIPPSCLPSTLLQQGSDASIKHPATRPDELPARINQGLSLACSGVDAGDGFFFFFFSPRPTFILIKLTSSLCGREGNHSERTEEETRGQEGLCIELFCGLFNMAMDHLDCTLVSFQGGKMEVGREGGRSLCFQGDREEVINSEGSCLWRTNGRGTCEETLDVSIQN